MKLTILFLLLSIVAFSQPTYFGSASNPADNGNTAGADLLAITPPASMVAGDLVVIYAVTRNIITDVTDISISDAGGQTWMTTSYFGGGIATPPTIKAFYCRYNGTWSANPSVNFTVVTAHVNSVVMHVFRPTVSTNKWTLGSNAANAISDAVAPFEGTITGITTTHKSTVSIAAWPTENNNTWGTLVGTGWTVLGSAQYRNLAGADQCITFAYYTRSTIGSTGNVTKTSNILIALTGSILEMAEYAASPLSIIEN